jgi:carbamoyl-phosphate synthase large subunit
LTLPPEFLKKHGVRTHALAKISEGSEEIPNAMRQGHIAYFINTKDPGDSGANDGAKLRQIATEYNVNMFTSLDTVKALLDVLEETTLTISTIDA